MKLINSFLINHQMLLVILLVLTNSCGNDVNPKQLPILTTIEISEVTEATAQSGGNITSNGGSDIIARGICWNTSPNPTIKDSITIDAVGSAIFVSKISRLTANTIYYVRAYATNGFGTSYGNEISFTTTANLPTLTTSDLNNITMSSAVIEGKIQDNGGSQITVYGFCWSTNPQPTVADNLIQEDFSSNTFATTITNLTIEKKYYVRAYATNSAGTAYSNEKSFKTTGVPMPINIPNIITFNSNLNYGTVTDIDGNVYKTITIGKYTWMAENLRVTKFRNGDPIPYLNDKSDWQSSIFDSLKIGLCDYQNTHNIDSIAKYGFLYALGSVFDSRNIAPIGWHVANGSEWHSIVLENTLSFCGIDWDSATIDKSTVNTSGLTILPSGWRTSNGDFSYKGVGFQVNLGSAWVIIEPSYKGEWGAGQIYRNSDGNHWGYSVRCVKDY